MTVNVSMTPNVTATLVSALPPISYCSFHKRRKTNTVVQDKTLGDERNDEWKGECVELLPGYKNRNKEQRTLGNTETGGNTIVNEQDTTMRRTLRSSNSLRSTLPVKQADIAVLSLLSQ